LSGSDRQLATWVAHDLETHLDQLAVAARQWRDGTGERSVVTIHLASGQRHTGQVLELVRSTLVLQSLPQRGTMDVNVTVIPLARIEALTVHVARLFVESMASPEAATSMLDLKRRVKALTDVLATRVGRAVTIDLGTGELGLLAPLFEALKLTLDRVCADELGRTSLAERVRRIELRIGSPGVSLANGTLAVTGPLAVERLRDALDAVL
jgi:hypothetical protein